MSETVMGKVFTWKNFRRFMIFSAIVGLICLLVLFVFVKSLERDLPSHEVLAEYEPPITSRVHAGDGALIAEFANEHRVFVPYESIPLHVVHAFVAAEDKTFFTHGGLDYKGILRGAINSAKNKISGSGGLQGLSLIHI